MIVYDLQCGDCKDVFEAWFGSSSDYDEQSARGFVECPVCRSTDVVKAPMAPRLPAKSAGGKSLAALAAMQAAMLKDSEWVGDRFADEARAMHAGECDKRPVHGQATITQAKSLIDEGVPIAPLPLPVVPPDQLN
jgi:hypothetical protein